MSASTDLNARAAMAASDSSVLLFARLAVVPLYLYSGVGKVMAFSATAGRLNGWADGFGSAHRLTSTKTMYLHPDTSTPLENRCRYQPM